MTGPPGPTRRDRAGASIGSPLESSADPAGEQGREAPALSRDAAGGAGKHRTTTTLKLLFAAIPAAARKELPCPTRL